MRTVTVSYLNDDGERQEVEATLNDKAILDVIDFVEEADQNEGYERGELLK